jgi:hypothetical protein
MLIHHDPEFREEACFFLFHALVGKDPKDHPENPAQCRPHVFHFTDIIPRILEVMKVIVFVAVGNSCNRFYSGR